MTRVIPFLLLVCALSGCVKASPPKMSPARGGVCRSESLRWFAPEDARHRARLDVWCAGVGMPALQAADSGSRVASVAIEDVTFVSWNVHVGNGNIRRLVADLRAGKLTGGRAVRHFILMLQEAVRDEGVPPYTSPLAGALRISAPDRSQDIVRISRDLGLALIYVPSMRNGNSPADPATDRGSALLSTLPLEDPIAVELPGERQRRVAIIASIAGRADDAGPPLSVT